MQRSTYLVMGYYNQHIADVNNAMKCQIITPIGPGHENAVEQAQQSVIAAAEYSKGPFNEIEHITIDDTKGELGRSRARNEVVSRSDADWLFFLDADDLMAQGAFEALEGLEQYDAVWGSIIEIANGNIAPRAGQVMHIESLQELKEHDPYLTIQMGHFVRANVAKENPFNEEMDCGEDFDYYLRVWKENKCIKTNKVLFINVRGNHSTGPRSATGKQWREAVESMMGRRKVEFSSYIAESMEQRKKNIAENMKMGLHQLHIRPPHAGRFGIVAGGPSLKKELGKIKTFQRQGGKVVALNGTHDYLIKHKIHPDIFVMADPRERNKRFLSNPDRTCVYFISADCHPEILDKLHGMDARLWVPIEYGEQSAPVQVGGGSTVTLRAISIGHILGFRDFEVFGWDGCVTDSHHAYDQPENDGESFREIEYNGNSYNMTNWMIAQAENFDSFLSRYYGTFKMKIHTKGVMKAIYERHAGLICKRS